MTVDVEQSEGDAKGEAREMGHILKILRMKKQCKCIISVISIHPLVYAGTYAIQNI